MTLILAIESSCDETAVAIYHAQRGLLSHSMHSQILQHQPYGGVVPELASRDHLTYIMPLIQNALEQAHIELLHIDIFAYTHGPGLAGALLIGASVANSLAFALNKPSLGIHHLEGHILSPLLADDKNININVNIPFLCLLVSGGNTQLIWVESINNYHILGETLDDSAGEAFDKTAKLLGMPYPGGPEVSQLAYLGEEIYDFPRPMKHSGCLDFSFAGLKTAVRTQIERMGGLAMLTQQNKANICASFVAAAADVLCHKAYKALQKIQSEYYTHTKRKLTLVAAGGVSANTQLRDKLNSMCAKNGYDIYYPPLKWCTDNAAMIALVAHLKIQQNPNILNNTKPLQYSIFPRLSIITDISKNYHES
jgi:N6-L-threonylcarbamoyladenine synthase